MNQRLDEARVSADGGRHAVRPAFPLGPLLATLAVQTLATAAAYSIPAVAPAVARDVGVNPALVGFYISTVYGVGILSAFFSPRIIHSQGGVRVSQAILLATLAMLGTAAGGTVGAIALSAALMGLAYGAAAPASTHLLVPRTPPEHMNVVLSLRQIGVPLGGMLAGLLMPAMTLWLGWQKALLIQALPVVLLGIWMEVERSRWEAGSRVPPPPSTGLLQPLHLLRGNIPLRRLSFVSFVYSGLQLCFIVFMTTQLTGVVGFDLVHAGQVLAAYQISGVVTRPIWGWLADRVLAARWLLVMQGAIMCTAALFAGQFSPLWPTWAVVLVCMIAGATASGYTGIAYGEYARLGGAQRTEATGLGAATMFAGVMVIPALTSIGVTLVGGYQLAYSAVGLLALFSAVLLGLPQRGQRPSL